MALIKCPECGQIISEYAEKCVSCGCPMERIKYLLQQQNSEKQVGKIQNNHLLDDRLTEEEQDFINDYKKRLLDSYGNHVFYSDTNYYKGFKIKGTNRYLLIFKKPYELLQFKYWVSDLERFSTIELKELNEDTTGQLLRIADNIFSKKSDSSRQVDNDEENTGPLFLDILTEEELCLVQSFRKRILVNYPKLFEFRNFQKQYIGRLKNGGLRVFYFSKRNNCLIFGYKHQPGKRTRLNIEPITESTLDLLMNIAQKVMGIILQQDDANDMEIIAPKTFISSLSDNQRKFVNTFQRIIETHYEKQFNVYQDVNYLSFKEVNNGTAIFWFMKKNDTLMFKYLIKGDGRASVIPIDTFTNEFFLNVLKKAKKASDSFDIISRYDKTDAENKKETKQANNDFKIYSCIRNEMLGNKYFATPSEKALCRNIKEFLIDTLNFQSTGNLNDPVFACSILTFYDHKLAWNKDDGIKSAKIVYNFFKAKTHPAKYHPK